MNNASMPVVHALARRAIALIGIDRH